MTHGQVTHEHSNNTYRRSNTYRRRLDAWSVRATCSPTRSFGTAGQLEISGIGLTEGFQHLSQVLLAVFLRALADSELDLRDSCQKGEEGTAVDSVGVVSVTTHIMNSAFVTTRPTDRRLLRARLGLWFLVLTAGTAAAIDCPFPGTHLTLQDAVDDAVCTSITLASGSFDGSATIDRSLVIRGPGAATGTLRGRLTVVAGTVEVIDLTIDGTGSQLGDCAATALSARNGGRVLGRNLVVVNATTNCGLFSDGFESGDTARWTAHGGVPTHGQQTNHGSEEVK